MPVTGIFQCMEALERGWHMQHVSLTVGGTGAVSAVSGKKYAVDGVATGEQGGIVRDSAGVYTLTLPGRGGVQEIVPVSAVMLDAAATDLRLPLVTARSTSARTITYSFVEPDGSPSVEEVPSGAVVEFVLLVRNSSVS